MQRQIAVSYQQAEPGNSMAFQSIVYSCRSARSAYSKTFHGTPECFSFTKSGNQLLFLSLGALYSDQLKNKDGVVQMEQQTDKNSSTWKKLSTSGRPRVLSRFAIEKKTLIQSCR